MARPLAQTIARTALLVAVLCVFASAVHAVSPALSALEKQIQQIVDERKDLTARIAKNSVELDKVADQIEQIKRDEGERPGLLAKYRLEKLLSRSLEMSRELDDEEMRLVHLDRQIDQLREAIVTEADAEIAETFAAMQEAKDRKESIQLVKQYFACREVKDRYRKDEQAGGFPKIVEFSEDELDTPRELLEKADFVRGFRKKVEAYAKFLDERIAARERDLRLSEEMNDLIRQELLFDEGSRYGPAGGDIAPRGGADTPINSGDDDATDDATSTTFEPFVYPFIDPDTLESDLATDRTRMQSIQQHIEEMKRQRSALDRILEMLNKQEWALRERAQSMLKSGTP